uniref:Aldehyde dehydrogenase n=1 Tax=Globodera rostochiensis TaxID=31243 RepID=A0A914HJL3_GLORO
MTSSFHSLVLTQREFFLTGKPAELTHRKQQLKRLRKAILDNKEFLCEAVHKDLKRDAKLNYPLELSSVIIEIEYMLDNLEDWMAPLHVEKTFTTMLDTPQVVPEPKGVVLVIGPWNYPLNTMLMPLVAVLAAGNTAILKPSEVAPNTAAAVDEVFSKAFERNYLAVVQGGVGQTGELLSEKFDHIMFTGSAPVARHILRAAATHLTPCTLELGGKSPVFIDSNVDIAITARRLAWGKWLNCGQTCLAPDYVMLTNNVKPRLVEELKTVLIEYYGTNPAMSKDYSRIINESHFDRLCALLKSSAGKELHKLGQPNREDLFIPPTILDVEIGDSLMQSEIFGPVLPIVTVHSFDEAIDVIKRGEKPLAAYLFTRDEGKVKKLVSETHSGSVCINDVVLQITVDTLPFGGVGESGMGRYRGKFGFDEFSHQKAVLKRCFFGDGIAAGRYPPLTDQKLKSLQQLTGKRRAVPRFLKALMPTVPYLLTLSRWLKP